MSMSFEGYSKYTNERRSELGVRPESVTELLTSYRAYLGAIELAGVEVDIKYELLPNSEVKAIFVPRIARGN